VKPVVQLAVRALILELGCVAVLAAQNRQPTQLDAARLAGCYAITWGDGIGTWDGPRLPVALQLTTQPFDALGWHRFGFYRVVPGRVADSSYTIWRPRGPDSLEIELMAGPVPDVLPPFFILARLASDTLRGTLGLLRPKPGEPAPAPMGLVPFVSLIAARKACS
jgi:hypothetical protein